MKALNINQIYANQVECMMSENGLEEDFGAVIKICTTMTEVFIALSNKAAEHIAVLTESGAPIENIFEFIREQLAANKPVALALIVEKDEATNLNT